MVKKNGAAPPREWIKPIVDQAHWWMDGAFTKRSVEFS
jgi:hypothetical protein